LAATGAIPVPAPPVPFGMAGGGPALAGHGPLSPAPSASSKKSTATLLPAGGTNTPEAPTNLAESPWDQSAVESTTPTLSATYNNAGSYTGYVQFEVLSYSGTVLATGQGTTVNPGSTSTWNYPTTAPPLQVGAEYKVEAESVSGSQSSGYDTNGTFYVDPRLAWGTQPWMTDVSWHPDSQMTVRVNAASGDLNVGMSMLSSVAGVNLPINLNFVSNAQQSSASGESHYVAWDWIDTFDENLYIDPTGQSATYFGPDGESAAFIKNGSSWNSPGGLPATLTSGAGGTYLLTWNSADSSHAAGQVDTFSSTGALTQEQSATGQTITINYSSGVISSITTSTGRTLDFNHYTSGADAGDLSNIQLAGSSFEVQFGYDSTGTLLTSITNSDNGITKFGYQSLNNQINSITTPAGRQLTIGYDSTGTRVASVSEVDNLFPTNPTWNFTYTQPTYTTGGTQCVPNQSQFECGTTVVQDPNSNTTTYTWDNADRVTNTKDAKGEAQATTWNSDNNVVSLTGISSQVESFQWDSTRDVLQKITNPSETLNGNQVNGSELDLTWSNTAPYTLSSVTDKSNTGSTLNFGYNADHEINQVTDGLSSQNTETATYQGIGGASCGGLTGDLCSITDFDGNTTKYGYDSAGDLTSITPPTQSGGTQLGTTTFGYNPLGQVTSKKDGNGNTTSYQWNGEGQVAKVTYQDGTSVSLGYDNDGNLLSETAPGGSSTFTYSPAGYMKTSDINGDNSSYTYDPVGNVKTVTGPLGTTTYSYSTVNELTSVVDPWGNTTVLTPDPNNDQLVGSVSIPGGTTETYGYDNANRVTSYLVGTPSGTQISTKYDYFTSGGADANLMQSSTNVLTSQTTSYSYDPLERLSSATGGPTSYSYTYNGDGDITSQDIGGAITNYSPNANHENAGDTYDASGNLTAYSALGSLTYNSGDQTTSITPNGGSKESISYLSDGQTLPTDFGSTSLSYNALGSDGLTGGNTAQILRTPGGQLLGEYTGGHPYYFLVDGGGSVAGLVNSTGTLEDSYTYSPYGAQTVATNNVYNPFAYDGGLTIPGTKLIQFGDRNYSPIRAGWLQPDPSGQNPGYVYAGDDPINAEDPTGEFTLPSWLSSALKWVGKVAPYACVAYEAEKWDINHPQDVAMHITPSISTIAGWAWGCSPASFLPNPFG
jgi:RHS repeat-associated protein